MRIAIFTNNYLPNPYGVSGSIESFRKEFERRGHTVYIFAPKTEGYVDENPNVFRYPSIDINYKISFPLGIPFSRAIAKKLNELDVDIIHSQHPNLIGWAAKKWAKKKNVPLVFTWHTLYDQYAHFAPPFIPQKFAQNWTINNAVKYANGADQVIVPTPSVKKIIQAWGVKNLNIVAIPTGIDEETFQNSDKEMIRNECGIAQGAIVVLLHSRLTEEKNILFVLRAMENVLKKNADVIFMISGQGNLAPRLKEEVTKKHIEQQVAFVEPLSREVLKNIYAAADLFVYGSKSETQGMVISEAMYAGLPIVAVAATGVKDLVMNHVTGLLVKENQEAFATAVQKLINDKTLRERFSQNAQKIAQEKYTSSVCAEKMLEVYSEVIKRKK